MADQPKEFKPKPKPPSDEGGNWQEAERWIFYIAIALLLYLVYLRIAGSFSGVSFFRTLARYPWQTILFFVKAGAVALSALGIYGIFRMVSNMTVLRQQLTAPPELPEELKMTQDEQEIHRAWAAVKEQLLSENASDWKLAVMSADAVMGEALDDMKIEGATMADKLKALGESRRLRSYEQLWDAHKVRNEIAHDPRRTLSQEEARRVVQYFEETLKELGAM
jgi:hypothetical protein